MRERDLIPSEVLAEAGTTDGKELVRKGVAATRSEQYGRGLILLGEAHKQLTQERDPVSDSVNDERDVTGKKTLPPAALSCYGLCLAVQTGKTEDGAKFCELAILREPFQPEHYLNLARLWQIAHNRRRMIEALERGKALAPTSASLSKFRRQVGYRKRPVVSFLPRESPLNKALGLLRAQLRSPVPPDEAGSGGKPGSKKKDHGSDRARPGASRRRG